LEVLSGKCPEFFTSGICLVLFIQNLSGILSCPEYVQLNCPEFFHVRNMSGFIYPEFVQNSFMSGICPVFSAHKNSGQQIWPFYWTFSRYFLNHMDRFRTFSMTFSGHFFFVGKIITRVRKKNLERMRKFFEKKFLLVYKKLFFLHSLIKKNSLNF
jgi:hypothetical protein